MPFRTTVCRQTALQGKTFHPKTDRPKNALIGIVSAALGVSRSVRATPVTLEEFIMKTITLAVMAMLSLAALTTAATPQSQTGDTAYEKKSYNYAEWAKGRFSEVVTVRNAGKIIYLGGVGAEDETSAQGGVIRHLGDFGAQCRYAWDKIKRLLEKHGATVENIDKVVTYVTDIRYFFEAGKCRAEAYAGATQPAGTFLVVSAFAWPGMLIEVDVTASTPK
jgi:enamine deaminase RidA (YjgF/YER057c/UK114 family)